jgi:glutamine amidotransferase
MQNVAIIDYGMGNLDSVARAVEECGGDPWITDQPASLEKAGWIILPGVGSFTDGMAHLLERGWPDVLHDHVMNKAIPFLGICLGMQLMASKGWEGGETAGLGWIPGEVKRLDPQDSKERIPHVGWNEVHLSKETPLFDGVSSRRDFYFVHSFHLACADDKDVLAVTPYCGHFASVVVKDRLFGVQFHPEKSQRFGLQILKNFLSIH